MGVIQNEMQFVKKKIQNIRRKQKEVIWSLFLTITLQYVVNLFTNSIKFVKQFSDECLTVWFKVDSF